MSQKILHADKSSVLHNNQRNALDELEWLKLQLTVDEQELQLMVMENKCKDVRDK